MRHSISPRMVASRRSPVRSRCSILRSPTVRSSRWKSAPQQLLTVGALEQAEEPELLAARTRETDLVPPGHRAVQASHFPPPENCGGGAAATASSTAFMAQAAADEVVRARLWAGAKARGGAPAPPSAPDRDVAPQVGGQPQSPVESASISTSRELTLAVGPMLS